jgi:hypothetical protein
MSIVKMNKTKTLNEKAEREIFNDSVVRPHAMNIEYFMESHKEAIRLQLSNLVATYGVYEVMKIVKEQIIDQRKNKMA